MECAFGFILIIGVPLSILVVGDSLRGCRATKLLHRRKSPICQTCGYDLRGSKGICPECGEPNPYFDREFWEQR
jgi:predicted amidophosphoribosyltransferase